MIEEVDTTLLTSQQKNVVRALQTDIGHYSNVFTAETSGAEIAITEAVTTGRHPEGPLYHCLDLCPLVNLFLLLVDPQRKAKSTCVNIVVKNLVSWVA